MLITSQINFYVTNHKTFYVYGTVTQKTKTANFIEKCKNKNWPCILPKNWSGYSTSPINQTSQLLHILYNFNLTKAPACWFFMPFHSSHGNFFSFWQVQCILGQCRADRKSSYSFVPYPFFSNSWIRDNSLKMYKKYSHAVYIKEKWVIRKCMKKTKKHSFPSISLVDMIFSHMTCVNSISLFFTPIFWRVKLFVGQFREQLPLFRIPFVSGKGKCYHIAYNRHIIQFCYLPQYVK